MAVQTRIAGALRRGWWAVPAAALLLGSLAFLAVWERDDDAVAEVTLVASAPRDAGRPAGPLAETLAQLVESQVTLDNVIGNLRLDLRADDLRDAVSTKVEDARIVIRAEDPDEQRAVRIAQEIALVFSQLVRERFAPPAGSGETVIVFDSARAIERESRNPLPFAVGGGVAGALLAGLVLFLTSRRAFGEPPAPGSSKELRARERGAVERHANLASRARELDERERLLVERVAAVTRRELELARTAAGAPRAAVPEPAEPLAQPSPAPVKPPAAPVAPGAFSLPRLEQLVTEARGSHPQERAEEWLYYLVFLREHADHEGRLPRSFDGLVVDVFGELLS